MNRIGFKTWVPKKRDASYLDEFPDIIELLPDKNSANWLPNQLAEHAVIANAIRSRVQRTTMTVASIPEEV